MTPLPEALNDAYAWLQGATGLSPMVLGNLIRTIVVLVVLGVIRALLVRLVHRRTSDVRAQYQWRKAVSYTTVGLGFLLIGRIWIAEFGALATFLGLLSAGIAIALRDLLVAMAGWMFIVWRKPFRTGDRIAVVGHAGDVIDQRLFQFTLLEIGTVTGAGQSTGRIIHVPNGKVFSDPVINYTRGFQYIWNEVPVVVTFESNWRAAKEILAEIAHDKAESLSEDAERRVRQAAQEYMIFYTQLTPTVYTDVIDIGVRLTIRYLVEPRRRRGSEQLLWESILDAFDQREDIDFAYPTSRLYFNPHEGKPAARADLPTGEQFAPHPMPGERGRHSRTGDGGHQRGE
jgi:small-conductance mechanosensitive channel